MEVVKIEGGFFRLKSSSMRGEKMSGVPTPEDFPEADQNEDEEDTRLIDYG